MRKRHWFYIVVLTGALVGYTGYHNSSPPAPEPAPIVSPEPVSEPSPSPVAVSQSGCDPALWLFVYHPNRLPAGTSDCRNVTGIVKWVKAEPDGDYHVRLQLDDPTSAPVNSKNIGGYLVVEPICQNTPTQQDAIGPCSGYNGPKFPLPKVGDHVSVSGFYTIDTAHGWMEIHAANHLESL